MAGSPWVPARSAAWCGGISSAQAATCCSLPHNVLVWSEAGGDVVYHSALGGVLCLSSGTCQSQGHLLTRGGQLPDQGLGCAGRPATGDLHAGQCMPSVQQQVTLCNLSRCLHPPTAPAVSHKHAGLQWLLTSKLTRTHTPSPCPTPIFQTGQGGQGNASKGATS